MSVISRLTDATMRPLASTEGRKRALIVLVAAPLLLVFGLGAALGTVAAHDDWGPVAIGVVVVVAAVCAALVGRRMLAAAQSIRRRQTTAWIPEKLRPLAIEVSTGVPQRINILHPAIDLKHFFGGFIAVFNLARRLAERGHRVRLIATERSELPADWRRRLSDYEGLGDVLERIEVVFANDRQSIPFNPGDGLIATHWTVAHIANQAAAELGSRPFVYLIQEYEPFIFAHGSAAALARQSYDLRHGALFSTALLRDYFAAHRIGVFATGEEAGCRNSVVFDNAITPVGGVAASDLRRSGAPRLLFYARPEQHAQRNLFEIGVMALDEAAARGWLDDWELVGVGSVEAGVASLMLPSSGARVEMVPRRSQGEYAGLLRSGDIGLALMYTPHPSLVPIEMASAGMITVTNTYENKDAAALAAISPNLIAAEPTVSGVAAGLREATLRCGDIEARVASARVHWPASWEETLEDGVMAEIEALLAVEPPTP